MTVTIFLLILALVGASAAAVLEWVRAEYWRSQYRATFEPIEPVQLPNLRRYAPEWSEEVEG